jgi:hypothetical protein
MYVYTYVYIGVEMVREGHLRFLIALRRSAQAWVPCRVRSLSLSISLSLSLSFSLSLWLSLLLSLLLSLSHTHSTLSLALSLALSLSLHTLSHEDMSLYTLNPKPTPQGKRGGQRAANMTWTNPPTLGTASLGWPATLSTKILLGCREGLGRIRVCRKGKIEDKFAGVWGGGGSSWNWRRAFLFRMLLASSGAVQEY